MRTGRLLLMTVAILAMAGCSAPESAEPSGKMEVAEPPAQARAKSATGAAPVDVTLPKIAYVYSLGFRVPAGAVAKVQDAHLALCDRLGPARCVLSGMNRSDGEGERAEAAMTLRVATRDARPFARALEQAAASGGGRMAETEVEAEDVSKAMVDADARIRQRELLVARLTEILRARTGKVAELVEAERSVAQAQEELDQARGLLAELRRRVAYSTFTLRYTGAAAAPGGAMSDAIVDSAASFGAAIRSIAVALIYLFPWLVIGGLAFFGWRRWLGPLVRRRQREERSPG
ncbi:DUF4349 domain-containing protein [Sphingomonas sp. FW199]|uniref:DUF4349 domain-containing protein n=1 Tax=Sphingomonas sp. FW199 TaxID=3400217 RepID=UPI003CF78A0B